MDTTFYVGIAIIVIQLLVILYLFFKRPVVTVPKECPTTTQPQIFTPLDPNKQLQLPDIKQETCPPLPVINTVSAEQKNSGQGLENKDFDLRCFGSDNYINQLTVRAGDFIDGLTITCKTNTDQTFPWAGGEGGTQTILPSQKGFSKLGIQSNEFIYGLQPYDQDGNPLTMQGKKGPNVSSLDCGAGVLAGIKGKYASNKYGTYITQINKGFCIPPKPIQSLQ